MDTDQNNVDRGETKAALLGELESIKDLLSEEEMADIPLLDQPLGQTFKAITTGDDEFSDIPLLEETVSLDPLVDISLTTNGGSEPGAESPSKTITDTPFDELSESIDVTLANINIDIDLSDEIIDPELQAAPIEDETSTQTSPPDDTTTTPDHSFAQEDELDTAVIVYEEPTTPLEQEIADLTHNLEESLLDDEPLSAAPPPALEKPKHGKPPISDVSANFTGINTEFESRGIDPGIEEALGTEEKPLPVGVLPGQRNLFDESVIDSSAPEDSPNQKIDTQEQVKRSNQAQSKPRVKMGQAKGENPFLPKHIRERLHTTKSLMDVIKEAPLDTQAVYHNKFVSEHPEAQALEPSKESRAEKLSDHDKLDILINEVIAEFMPKIEAELRARLTTNLTASTNSENDAETDDSNSNSHMNSTLQKSIIDTGSQSTS